MIKKTLYFGNPAYLSTKNEQLVVNLPDTSSDTKPITMPIEDIGVVVLDCPQITVSQVLMERLLANNTALVTCNSSHLPFGLMMPLDFNTVQSERFRHQIDASEPLKKQLWQQTVKQKIINQACVLRRSRGLDVENMLRWSREVLSGDTNNEEAKAAAYYWSKLFPQVENFTRGREESEPNNLLNYGYAILRAVVARALVGSGLLPTLGIHHRNKYNAYCLADDIMEPYRPFVDMLVVDIIDSGEDFAQLTKQIKQKLLSIPVLDVNICGRRSPLMIAVGQTTASLAKCFLGEQRRIEYPEFQK